MQAEFVVKYEGLHSDRHILPAYEGAASIQGISRSLTLITTYLGTGKVRKNAPFESPISLFLQAPRAGSFDTIYQLMSQPGLVTYMNDISLNITASLIYDAVKVVFNQVTGRAARPQHEPLRELLRQRDGDFAALEDAVEPAVIMAHKVIGTGSNNIVIFGDNNQIVFNRETKEFVTTSIEDNRVESKDVSIASYNANTKSGRVYDFEFERTVPFALSSSASRSSAVAIARGLAQYTRGDESRVSITYKKILAPDSRVKKYIITRAARAREDA